MCIDRSCCGHDDSLSRPLSLAFAPHVVVACKNEDTLRYARFSNRADWLLRRESQFRGSAQHFLDKIKEGRVALHRLREYGIHVPYFTYVLARDAADGEVSLFTAIERVHGENITVISPVEPMIAREVEHVFMGFTSYLRDARKSGLPFWTDFNIHQFMYGTLVRDATPRLYLVDVEPYAARWPRELAVSPPQATIAWRSYIMQLMSLYLGISWFEEHNNKGIHLKKARGLLLRTVRAVPPAPLYDEFRNDLLALLLCGGR